MKHFALIGLVVASLWALQACGNGSEAEDRAKFVADSIARADSLALADSLTMADSLAQAYIADSLARVAGGEGVSAPVRPVASKPDVSAPTPTPKEVATPDKVDASDAAEMSADGTAPSKGGSRTDTETGSTTPSKGGSRTDVDLEKPKKPTRPSKGGSRTEGEGGGGGL